MRSVMVWRIDPSAVIQLSRPKLDVVAAEREKAGRGPVNSNNGVYLMAYCTTTDKAYESVRVYNTSVPETDITFRHIVNGLYVTSDGRGTQWWRLSGALVTPVVEKNTGSAGTQRRLDHPIFRETTVASFSLALDSPRSVGTGLSVRFVVAGSQGYKGKLFLAVVLRRPWERMQLLAWPK